MNPSLINSIKRKQKNKQSQPESWDRDNFIQNK